MTESPPPAVKICGLTRPEDAALAAKLGARYVGTIMAGGPRQVTPQQARTVFAAAGDARRVVVFGDQPVEAVARVAEELSLDVVQLHGGATVDALTWLAARSAAARWAVVRLAGDEWPVSTLDALAPVADGVLLDARVAGVLGGTGVALPWDRLADRVHAWRAAHPAVQVVLAGGLSPERVAEAIRWLSPDVLDVSSGIERAPGIKDADRMRAFFDAVEHGHG
ncbi:MAG: phosphoribosylanthranilate isomerase [Gemmatimonadaceae bacterium]|nr:phosphoribosylanthranilate isomerase [Gemmatimonadaceae bacterium]